MSTTAQTTACLKRYAAKRLTNNRIKVDDDKFERLREQFADTYTGSGNNGKPIILEGGLKWQPFGFNLRDAEFLGGKTSSKKDICEVLGVPTQLIGIEGSQTYANYEQARAAFYEDRQSLC